MDQIKIGKFIAELRKEKGMTQLELANRLGITDRAVSKWENGRGLPDLSLIKPLCEELSISINELLSGERIQEDRFTEKAEENIISTIEYSDKNIKYIKKVFFFILAAIMIFLLLLGSCYGIDINRMRHNQPVVFSTWGYSYTPPIDLSEEEIELSIKEYLMQQGDNEVAHHEGEKTFVAFRNYLIEETEKGTKYIVYAWVLQEKYYQEGKEIKQDSGYSIPYKFTVEKQDDAFVVTDARFPRDGYHAEDMKQLFPWSVRRDMDAIHRDGTYEKLEMQIQEQIKLYFHP